MPTLGHDAMRPMHVCALGVHASPAFHSLLHHSSLPLSVSLLSIPPSAYFQLPFSFRDTCRQRICHPPLAVAMEALPLFLDRLANPITAIIMSVTAVLVFGEIVPQAICTK